MKDTYKPQVTGEVTIKVNGSIILKGHNDVQASVLRNLISRRLSSLADTDNVLKKVSFTSSSIPTFTQDFDTVAGTDGTPSIITCTLAFTVGSEIIWDGLTLQTPVDEVVSIFNAGTPDPLEPGDNVAIVWILNFN